MTPGEEVEQRRPVDPAKESDAATGAGFEPLIGVGSPLAIRNAIVAG